ncbi:MAG: response regulator [Planctomycetes bacterium]|nr:response regulator [Planctomycetota bacterium]
MKQKLRIAVADDDEQMRSYYRQILTDIGHEVIAAAENGQELVDGCRENRPDLVITDIQMPDVDGISAVIEICREEPLPVILVSAYHDENLLQRAALECILAYLIKPIKRHNLETAITLAMQRFRQFQSLHQEANDLRQALEDRKVIEKAKGIMMKRAMLDEPTAFRRLQKLASDKNLKLVALALQIVTADEAFK